MPWIFCAFNSWHFFWVFFTGHCCCSEVWSNEGTIWQHGTLKLFSEFLILFCFFFFSSFWRLVMAQYTCCVGGEASATPPLQCTLLGRQRSTIYPSRSSLCPSWDWGNRTGQPLAGWPEPPCEVARIHLTTEGPFPSMTTTRSVAFWGPMPRPAFLPPPLLS